MKDIYVSFETAKLLKEKGFVGNGDIGCRNGIYVDDNNYPKGERIDYDDLDNNELDVNEYYRVTQQMALVWLLEKGLYIVIKPHDRFENDIVRFKPVVYTKYKYNDFAFSKEELFGVFTDFNEAVEEALKYCLTTLL